MSSSKSSYPERPARPSPKKPAKGKGRPSSEHISGKRKGKIEVATAAPDKSLKLAEAHIALNQCVANHSSPALERFFKMFRHNKVPVRMWGGRQIINT